MSIGTKLLKIIEPSLFGLENKFVLKLQIFFTHRMVPQILNEFYLFLFVQLLNFRKLIIILSLCLFFYRGFKLLPLSCQ